MYHRIPSPHQHASIHPPPPRSCQASELFAKRIKRIFVRAADTPDVWLYVDNLVDGGKCSNCSDSDMTMLCCCVEIPEHTCCCSVALLRVLYSNLYVSFAEGRNTTRHTMHHQRCTDVRTVRGYQLSSPCGIQVFIGHRMHTRNYAYLVITVCVNHLWMYYTVC